VQKASPARPQSELPQTGDVAPALGTLGLALLLGGYSILLLVPRAERGLLRP
jgi:LPXTG-motif cell wall-anchored protein